MLSSVSTRTPPSAPLSHPLPPLPLVGLVLTQHPRVLLPLGPLPVLLLLPLARMLPLRLAPLFACSLLVLLLLPVTPPLLAALPFRVPLIALGPMPPWTLLLLSALLTGSLFKTSPECTWNPPSASSSA